MAPRSLGGKIGFLTLEGCLNFNRLSGVVDQRLKIYGLTNVRVVDSSVIPLTTGVAIQSTVYAIAEKVRQLNFSLFCWPDLTGHPGRRNTPKRV
jgi:GMC oxidoreductase